MPKPFNRYAALALAKSAIDLELKDNEIPADEHDLDNGLVTIHFPPTASVIRDQGTEGDGYNASDPTPPLPLEITLEDALRFIEESSIGGGAKVMARWKKCIEDRLKPVPENQVPNDHVPSEAMAALAIVQNEQPSWIPGEKIKKPTTIKRNGTKEVVIEAKRLVPAKAAAKGSSSKARKKGAA